LHFVGFQAWSMLSFISLLQRFGEKLDYIWEQRLLLAFRL